MVYQIKYKKRGFTLIEIILVISLLGIFGAISTSYYSNYKNHSDLKIVTYDVVEALRHAQSNAQKMKADSMWGVKITTDNIVVFKGSSYASRDTDFDQKLNFPKKVTITGSDEIVFDKLSGVTNDIGTTTVTNQDGFNDIYINEKGTITY